jgi:glucose/arabinose dehydrogenase
MHLHILLLLLEYQSAHQLMNTHIRLKLSFLCLILMISQLTNATNTARHGIAAYSPPDSVKPVTEADFYKIVTIPIPEGVILEVGGLAALPDGRLAVSTRRGEVWLVQNPYLLNQTRPHFKRFAFGLHEPLGLAYTNGVFYTSQRSELTRLQDTNGDGKADLYERVFAWPLSGNYHEYSYGPKIMSDGNLLVTLNLAWVGKGASLTKWRGWMLKITPDGKVIPFATGMRSPAGYGMNSAGDVFYAENQGDWVGSGRLTHVENGDFVGNPAGLLWSGEPDSPVKLKISDIPDNGESMYKASKSVSGLKPPAVWFPHSLMGISTSDILEDNIGSFGPFQGQMFVGDQGHSKVMRVFMEKVKGVYQGACFPFREGFSSGILRMIWGNDGSMVVGMTSRGWSATGKEPYGLQRLVWTGKTPFEIRTMRAQPDGFELEFTLPVDNKTAQNLASYAITSFNYKYHHFYGSPVIEKEDCPIRGVVLSEDGLRARLVVENLREGYIHELKAEGIRSRANAPLLHNVGYYTLNNLPEGEKLALAATNASKAHLHTANTKSAPAKTSTKTTSNASSAQSTANSKETTQAKRLMAMPASWTKGPDQTISVGTKPGLNLTRKKLRLKPAAVSNSFLIITMICSITL